MHLHGLLKHPAGGGVIDQRYSDAFIASREKVQFVIEGVGGCRIGEVAGAGEGHGILADNVAILEDMSKEPGTLGSCVVEGYLEHSKTGFSRYLDFAGKTVTSQIECAKLLQEYWQLAGMRVVTSTRQGIRVMRPDRKVVRVSLLGLGAPTYLENS